MKILTLGYVYLAYAVLSGALVPIVLDLMTGFSMSEYFMLTFFLGFLFALVPVFITKKQSTLASYLKNPKKLGLISLLAVLVLVPFNVAILYAENFVSASLATVVFRLSPLLMLLFIPLLLRERLSRIQILALVLGFVGVYIALTGGQLSSIFGNPDLAIVSMLVLAALAYALSILLMKKYVFELFSELVIFNLVLFALSALVFMLEGAPISPLQPLAIFAIIFIAADNVVGWYTTFYAYRVLKTTFVANTFFLSPFITLLFASVLLGEIMQPYYLLIAGLITAGLILQRFDKKGGTYLARKSSRARSFAIFDVSGAFASTGELAIARSLDSGARVMAVRLPAKRRGTVESRIKEGGYSNVFTSDHKPITDEVGFVREIMGAEPEDMILMKVGSFDEGEEFFGDMADLVGDEHISPITK